MIESPITKHTSMIDHQLISYSFVVHFEYLHDYKCAKWRFIILSFELYKQRDYQEEAWIRSIVQITKCLKKTIKPTLFSNPIFSSFFVQSQQFKRYLILQLKLYKTSLNSKGNRVTFKNFKLQITNYFNTPIPKHEPHLLWNLVSSSFFVFFSDRFMVMNAPSEGID